MLFGSEGERGKALYEIAMAMRNNEPKKKIINKKKYIENNKKKQKCIAGELELTPRREVSFLRNHKQDQDRRCEHGHVHRAEYWRV